MIRPTKDEVKVLVERHEEMICEMEDLFRRHGQPPAEILDVIYYMKLARKHMTPMLEVFGAE